MKANRLRAMRAHPSGSLIRVNDAQTVPSYLQRYAAEREAWSAQRRAATAHTVRRPTSENDDQRTPAE